MRKSELIAAVADSAELSEREAGAALEAFVEQITNALSRGEFVNLLGFGRFSVKVRQPRSGRNPQTGATIDIPASKLAQFKAGKRMREAMLPPPPHPPQ